MVVFVYHMSQMNNNGAVWNMRDDETYSNEPKSHSKHKRHIRGSLWPNMPNKDIECISLLIKHLQCWFN